MAHDLKGKPSILVSGSDAAPVVFFDGVYAWGVNNGVVQIETAAHHLVPTEGASVKTKVVAAGHLRCSFVAAVQLRDMLDAAIKSQAAGEKRAN